MSSQIGQLTLQSKIFVEKKNYVSWVNGHFFLLKLLGLCRHKSWINSHFEASKSLNNNSYKLLYRRSLFDYVWSVFSLFHNDTCCVRLRENLFVEFESKFCCELNKVKIKELNKMTFPSDDEDKKGDESRRRRPKFIRKVECSVCGDTANDHIHYGAIACYSCKTLSTPLVLFISLWRCFNFGK